MATMMPFYFFAGACERKHSLLVVQQAPDIRPLARLDSCVQESD